MATYLETPIIEIDWSLGVIVPKEPDRYTHKQRRYREKLLEKASFKKPSFEKRLETYSPKVSTWTPTGGAVYI